MKFIKKISIPVLILFSFAVLQASADTAVIQNEIRAEANTGNKSSSGGTVETGEASASVKVRTVVDSEVIEDIEREVKGTGSVEASVETNVETSVEASVSAGVIAKILNLFRRLQIFLLNLF